MHPPIAIYSFPRSGSHLLHKLVKKHFDIYLTIYHTTINSEAILSPLREPKASIASFVAMEYATISGATSLLFKQFLQNEFITEQEKEKLTNEFLSNQIDIQMARLQNFYLNLPSKTNLILDYDEMLKNEMAAINKIKNFFNDTDVYIKNKNNPTLLINPYEQIWSKKWDGSSTKTKKYYEVVDLLKNKDFGYLDELYNSLKVRA